MAKHNLIAVDLAKNVFQVCGMTARNKIIFNKPLKRRELPIFMANQPATEIAMEACYTSHYWARDFEAMGHTVRLIPAQHVSPFVRGNKSDRNDAIAIAEASRRPNIKTVPVKSIEQQDIQSLHRIRERLVANRVALVNQTKGLLAEYGIVVRKGHKAFCSLLHQVTDSQSSSLSPMIKVELRQIAEEYYWLTDRLNELQQQLTVIATSNPLCKLLLSIPGIGVINATLIYSAIGNGAQFKNGRELAVWLGLAPRQASSGDSFKSGGITKRGNRHLRKQLVHGARSALSRCRNKSDKVSCWANQLVARRGFNKACVAMAARMARTCWILLNRKEAYCVQAD